MLSRNTIPALVIVLATITPASASDIVVSVTTDAGPSVEPGGLVSYDVSVSITNTPIPADTLGVCLFSINLRTDLGVDQSPVDAFAPEVVAAFDAISPQSGVPDSQGGVAGIIAAQSCNVDAGSALGIGLGGSSPVASGTLRMPTTPGTYTVSVEPAQFQLISADGNRGISPGQTEGRSTSILVSVSGGSDDQDDAGTDGLGDGEDSDSDDSGDEQDDTGTDGIGDDNGDSGAGDEEDANTDGIGGASQDPQDEATTDPTVRPTLGLCGGQATVAAVLGVACLLALRFFRHPRRPSNRS